MARVKRGVAAHAKHKKTLAAAKGFYGRRKNTIRTAKAAVDRSMQYATRDRRVKKRTFRALWIQRLNAAVRELGLTYSRFINGLDLAGIEARPEGSVGPRGPRAGSLRRDRREGQGPLCRPDPARGATDQKSVASPLISQSPYRIGSAPPRPSISRGAVGPRLVCEPPAFACPRRARVGAAGGRSRVAPPEGGLSIMPVLVSISPSRRLSYAARI